MTKPIDNAKKIKVAVDEKKSWCEYIRKSDSQRDGVIYHCGNPKATSILISGTDQPCKKSDKVDCPFLIGMR